LPEKNVVTKNSGEVTLINREKIMNDELLKEIELYIEYGVPANEKETAVAFLNAHKNVPVLLTLLKEYYTSLPHAREEAVLRVCLLDAIQGTFLLGVTTTQHEYFYCADFDNAAFVGEKENGIEEEDVLLFFGYSDNEEFKKQLSEFKDYPEYRDYSDSGDQELCPVCSVKEGENHHLGCSVEICPWCEGPLNNCNCRFEQLGVDEIASEEEVLEFAEMLHEKGRIPFEKGQGPSYPIAGDDKLELKKK